MDHPPRLQDKLLISDNVVHGFFGRRGGVSAGIYGSLNCGLGTDDEIDAVRENRARVTKTLEGAQILTLWQHHSADCLTVMDEWSDDRTKLPKADAMVTNRPGFALGILTADCAPVLFTARDKEGRPIIGAAHAGWKGALAGVIENTVMAMRKLGAENIAAAVGPSIAQRSYEVSADFMMPFLERDQDNARYFAAGKNDSVRQFDLTGYVAAQLKQAGIKNVSVSGADTYSLDTDYFSYRRTTHRKEGDYGRQISIIAIGP
ncbi:MAG TPA: peptidoglycan editing factor PgeF [Patescibacteria group bacterium]|nr:peptidoglycan editing factor PgeF [Patescibacteria group bacterium]